jgi:hypothetical protein
MIAACAASAAEGDMKARVLSQAQRESLEDLLTVVEMHETKLRAALPGALGQKQPVGDSLGGAYNSRRYVKQAVLGSVLDLPILHEELLRAACHVSTTKAHSARPNHGYRSCAFCM